MKDYHSCIEVFKNHKQPCSAAFFNRALLRYDQKDIDGALKDIQEAVEQDPSNTEYFRTRALLLRKKDDFIKSIADVELVRRFEKKKHELDDAKGDDKISLHRHQEHPDPEHHHSAPVKGHSEHAMPAK
jgi:tetratricopeptide (TPR) repeat protein